MLKTIRVDQLQLGMHLHSLGGGWLDHPFWKTRFELRDPADLAALRASGVQQCVIDTARGRDVEQPVAVPSPPPAPVAEPAPAAPLRTRLE